MSIKISPKELAGKLKAHNEEAKKALRRGANSAAHRAVLLLKEKSPVDQGQYRNAWQVKRGADGMPSIGNDAPHAGIIERGARPHPVSEEGIEALTAWAMRRLGLDEKEARGVAFAIAKKLRERGQEPKWIVRNAMNEIVKITRQEVEAELRRIGDK